MIEDMGWWRDAGTEGTYTISRTNLNGYLYGLLPNFVNKTSCSEKKEMQG